MTDAQFIASPMRLSHRLFSVTSSQHLTPKQNERLRKAIRDIIRFQFDGKVSRFAEAVKRAQPSISDFLNGRSGASYETARRTAILLGKEYEAVVGEPEELPAEPSPQDEAENIAKAISTFRGVLLDEAILTTRERFSGAKYESLDVWDRLKEIGLEFERLREVEAKRGHQRGLEDEAIDRAAKVAKIRRKPKKKPVPEAAPVVPAIAKTRRRFRG